MIMYTLPANPTARDILARSIECHNDAFRASLIEQAEMHDDWASTTINERARQGAVASFNACLRAYDFAGRDDLPVDERAACIAHEMGPMIIALNVACKLQDLPAHVRTQAAIAA
jgi:hypothetical protein